MAGPTGSTPGANARTLTRLIPAARLVLYPDSAHAFLFQDGTQFAVVVGSLPKASNAA
jgi:hypothetical protein